MRIILSNTALEEQLFPKDVSIIKVDKLKLKNFENKQEVIAVVGTRAMAIATAEINFPGLKLFQLTSAGYDGVPLEKFTRNGISVANAGTVYSVPIAETVVLGMLLMTKRLHKNPNNRRAKFKRNYDDIVEMKEKRILILGTGSIGVEIARRLKGFDTHVDGFNRSGKHNSLFENIICSRVNLMKVINNYDFIISTLPENEQTKSMIDREILEKISASAIVINVGRKSVFDEKALYEALKNKKINGAVLDMFEYIPNPITNRFRRLSNVIVLPSVSAISQEVEDRLRKQASDNILSAIKGEAISNIINKAGI